ncbi:peptidase M20/M25/M40 family protein [hydrothermal vent metagenome]|uniref:Peptidase M20/M25/M40 family protein n=1 Tax=hydrothermal vent metagenome TaxID=652676 RepID=A0A3B0RZ71_9ZZZZ
MRFLLLPIISLLLLVPAVVNAGEITETDLRAHIEILAGDDFGGRKPGTEGENKSVNYIASQWAKAGLKPAANASSWYTPVTLVERVPVDQEIRLTLSKNGRRKPVRLNGEEVILRGRTQFDEITDAQVVFAGYSVAPSPEGSTGLSGKLVLLPLQAPRDNKDIADYSERKASFLAAGATGIITIIDDGGRWVRNLRRYRRPGTTLAGEDHHATIEGLITKKQVRKLFKKSGVDFDKARAASVLPDARLLHLPVYSDLSVETSAREYQSHNVIGKIPGTKPDRGAVLFLGHWDHFGTCRTQDANATAQDLICNGAIDNASGISLLIEVAKQLAGTRPDRDIYFLATTAEELGLLGAKAFVENPLFPLNSLVAVFNADTIALTPEGKKIAVVGRGETDLDTEIEKVANAERREIDMIDKPNAYLKRQDGYVFLEKGIPAFMITSAFADEERLNAFINKRYHDVTDQLDDGLLLGGAKDDANFHVALGKYFANTLTYPQKATSDK